MVYTNLHQLTFFPLYSFATKIVSQKIVKVGDSTFKAGKLTTCMVSEIAPAGSIWKRFLGKMGLRSVESSSSWKVRISPKIVYNLFLIFLAFDERRKMMMQSSFLYFLLTFFLFLLLHLIMSLLALSFTSKSSLLFSSLAMLEVALR